MPRNGLIEHGFVINNMASHCSIDNCKRSVIRTLAGLQTVGSALILFTVGSILRTLATMGDLLIG